MSRLQRENFTRRGKEDFAFGRDDPGSANLVRAQFQADLAISIELVRESFPIREGNFASDPLLVFREILSYLILADIASRLAT